MNPDDKPIIDIGGGTKKAYHQVLEAYPVLQILLERLNSTYGRIGMGLVALGVIGAMVWSHISADHSAAMYLDIQRVSNLQQLNLAIQQYYQDNKILPANLKHIEQAASPAFMRDGYMFDPATHQPFEYNVVDAQNYEICAHFTYSTKAIVHKIPSDILNPTWDHSSGTNCFHFNPPPLSEDDNQLVP